MNGDFGGYILKNKLWFYGGASKQEIDQLQIGYVEGPNAAGCWTCPDAPPGTVIRILKQQYSKFSWQASPATKVIGTFVHAEKVTPFFGFSATTPQPTTRVQSQPTQDMEGRDAEHAEQPNVHRRGVSDSAAIGRITHRSPARRSRAIPRRRSSPTAS